VKPASARFLWWLARRLYGLGEFAYRAGRFSGGAAFRSYTKHKAMEQG